MSSLPGEPTPALSRAALFGAVLAGLVCVLHACNEYEPSLLKYADAGTDLVSDVTVQAEGGEEGPEPVPEPAPEAGEDGPAPEAAPEAGAEADAELPDAQGSCSATMVDCDGSEENGCEANLESNPHHCGACGHDCLEGGCAAGRCLPWVLASGQQTPSMLALDATHLYWGNQVELGSVMRIAKAGGTPELVANSASPGGLATDSAAVYWSEVTTNSTVWRMDKSAIGQGGVPAPLTTNQGMSAALSVDHKDVYFTTTSMVKRLPKGGGALEIIASAQQQPGGLVAELGVVFWTNVLGGTVVAADEPDGGLLVIASGQNYPLGLTSDTGNLYWTNHMGAPDGGSPCVMKIAKVNMTEPVVLAEGQAGPMGITQSGSYVFWTNSFGGTVMRVAKLGGTPEVLASGQEAPAGIAVDADRVYWSNRDSGEIMALAR